MIATEEDMKLFTKLYEKAVKEKKSQFIFKDKPVLTNYAKYVLEHLKNVEPFKEEE